MLFATRPHLFHSRLLALLVIVGGLASGCQSSRPSFSFQPMPGRVREVKTAEAIVAAPQLATTPATTATDAPVVQPMASAPIARKYRHGLLQPQPVVASVESTIITPLTTARPVVRYRRPLLARHRATAEAGLGTTVLGVLGLVVLPIALLGLLLSGGGLVWGIVAGAAALAVLVAYLDPFGRR